MRNIFSIAACALALTCAGTAQAANESGTVSSVTNQITGQLQQLAQFAQGNPTTAPKTQTAFDAGGTGSRSRTAATAPALEAEEQTGQAMLLAGLLVMGVIIKRRYGKRD
ncbi:hypothetical protein [Pseudorhodoferax soli]|uniref:Secreted protein with PEP-CTERM sorting signal n=1 Tax=Pseudorhodoferax soli TaxID=545864 RepID=A0A368Y8K2_9BURK|nr:hypothetical protein [Pseudorhodoferax soli]RCW76049.1 hypothetical protein DES41_101653 [Pseudorhodoferax soli]